MQSEEVNVEMMVQPTISVDQQVAAEETQLPAAPSPQTPQDPPIVVSVPTQEPNQQLTEEPINVETPVPETPTSEQNENEGNVQVADDPLEPEKPSVFERIKSELQGVVKSFLFGGLDGIIAIFVSVGTIFSSNVTMLAIVIICISKLFSGAISMAIGDFISTRAEVNMILTEKKREIWEYDNYLQGERNEMVEILNEKGMSLERSKEFVEILSANKEAFVNMMMVHELGLEAEADRCSPLKNACANFCAFVTFGAVPILVYIVAAIVDKIRNAPTSGPEYTTEANIVFGVCVALTVFTLALLGCIKSRFTGERWWLSVGLTLFVGILACGVAFGIAALLEKVFNLKNVD